MFLMLLFSMATLFALTPDQALKRLIEGNKRFTSDQSVRCFDFAATREEALQGQSPFAVILGCSDSRVPPEIVFNGGVGDLFVVRTAGNVVSSVELDSMQYAVHQLRSNLIVVLGHQSCGAITAVMEGKTGDIQAIADLIPPSVKKSKSLEAAIKANVRWIVETLKQSVRFKELVAKKQIDIRGAYYCFKSGEVEFLDF